MNKLVVYLFLMSFLVYGCQTDKQPADNSSVKKENFGTVDGKEIFLYTLTNNSGASIKIINYGAIVQSLLVPDKNNKLGDVVLGYDSLSGYLRVNPYFGAIVGRYGNRIDKGKFSLDDKEYQLTINDGENHLHGGNGLDKKVWDIEEVKSEGGKAVRLVYNSPDGEEGYPGNVKFTVVYSWTDNNELRIDYTATTDKQTIVNPTHHSYFNLTGNPDNSILDHELMINADSFTPVNAGLITTGEIVPVEGTPMDFREPTAIGSRIETDYQQLEFGKGYDHNWVLNNYDGTIKKISSLYDPSSGRVMEILSDEPGLQFYSGNFLDGRIKGKGGVAYKFRTGLCLEAQHFPDSPNKNNFPSVVLKPGEEYTQTTIYKFSTK